MLQKLKYLLGVPAIRPVFIIGTGRSGTHWLGYSLGNHPEIRATIEENPMFKLSTRMALNAALEDKLFGRLVTAYKRELFKSAPRLYVDKSHPNIWLAERLQKVFCRSRFIGIERNPYATVASMMNHKGVSSWHRRWREFPIPNRFLGITHELADVYDNMPLASQCAIRWVAHRDRMNELRNTLGDDLFVISYESFAQNTEETIRELRAFLGLHAPIPIPDVKTESLDKWETQLSDEELVQIQDITGLSPDAVKNRGTAAK